MKALQRRLGITTIMVTHDQEEALTMADRIVVMNHGAVEQIGTPGEILSRARLALRGPLRGAHEPPGGRGRRPAGLGARGIAHAQVIARAGDGPAGLAAHARDPAPRPCGSAPCRPAPRTA